MGNRKTYSCRDIVSVDLKPIKAISALMPNCLGIRAVFYGTYFYVKNNVAFTLCEIMPDEKSGETRVYVTQDNELSTYLRLYIYAESVDVSDRYAESIHKFHYFTVELLFTKGNINLDKIDDFMKIILLLFNVLPKEDKKATTYQKGLIKLLKNFQSLINRNRISDLRNNQIFKMVDFNMLWLIEINYIIRQYMTEDDVLFDGLKYFWKSVVDFDDNY